MAYRNQMGSSPDSIRSRLTDHDKHKDRDGRTEEGAARWIRIRGDLLEELSDAELGYDKNTETETPGPHSAGR